MEKKVAHFVLERPARKSGGDRYLCVSNQYNEWSIYIPQSLSRMNNEPAPAITLEITVLTETEEIPSQQ